MMQKQVTSLKIENKMLQARVNSATATNRVRESTSVVDQKKMRELEENFEDLQIENAVSFQYIVRNLFRLKFLGISSHFLSLNENGKIERCGLKFKLALKSTRAKNSRQPLYCISILCTNGKY